MLWETVLVDDTLRQHLLAIRQHQRIAESEMMCQRPVAPARGPALHTVNAISRVSPASIQTLAEERKIFLSALICTPPSHFAKAKVVRVRRGCRCALPCAALVLESARPILRQSLGCNISLSPFTGYSTPCLSVRPILAPASFRRPHLLHYALQLSSKGNCSRSRPRQAEPVRTRTFWVLLRENSHSN